MTQRFKRSSGIVLPVTALPSKYGVGSIGEAAYDFVDFLVASGQTYWQILPVGPTGYGDSPYQTFSTVAGNPYFIDLDLLVTDGLLSKEDLPVAKKSTKVDYGELYNTRFCILHKAYEIAKEKLADEINLFALENKEWIIDYAMFMAIKEHFDNKPLWEWPEKKIQQRDKKQIAIYSAELHDEANFHVFMQYIFFKQWNKLKSYANSCGIQIIGDIPIYPSADSADVWSNSHLFKVDDNFQPYGIAGVPPDLYSATGQLWGNPVYDWAQHEKEGYKWWIERIRNTMKVVDAIRIDHFRGLCDYWEIPAGETTAIGGKWLPGPKMKLFDAIKKHLGDIPIIAEDLGIITDEVREFLDETGYPGMRVMIFGISEQEDNLHLPHNWPVNCVGYISTPDSETFKQMIGEVSDEDRDFIMRYIRSSSSNMGLDVISSVSASPAKLVMLAMQDVLWLGKEGRINIPSTVGGNWTWRMEAGQLTEELAEKLNKITKTYKR